MGKFVIKLLLFILITSAAFVFYLSYYGLETSKFDELINDKANRVNQLVKIKFQKTKIHLNIKNLNLVVKLQNPKVLIKNHEIKLSKLSLFLPIKSFFDSNFLLDKAEVAFIENDIKDITKITSIFIPRIINKQLNKVFEKGKLEGKFIIPFQENGTVSENYMFSGKISNASINLTKNFSLKNLTTTINLDKKSIYGIKVESGSLFELDLKGSNIILEFEERKIKVASELNTSGKINFSQIKKIQSLFNLNNNLFKDINGKISLKTFIDFDLDKKFKINNVLYETNGEAIYLELLTKKNGVISNYFPEYDQKIFLKNTNIKFKNFKSEQNLKLDGLIKKGIKFDSFKLENNYNYEKKTFDIKGDFDLTNSIVKVSKLNYIKNKEKKSSILFNLKFILNKYYKLEKLNFTEGNTKIFLSKLHLSKNFLINNFSKIKIKTFNDKFKNNDFSIDKSNKVLISGQIFDSEPLLQSLYSEDDKNTFSKNFKSKIKINFKKVLTGTDDNVLNFSMIAMINKGSYENLSLKGNFTTNEIVEMTIYPGTEGKKILQVISDRARPFIKNFNFIEGFDGGKLEYEAIITKTGSDSNLLITDFKVSKVPVLAKLLTLASLRGIADTLSGEGIHFDLFEMKSNSKGNLFNVEDALAIGPAVSILLDGYIDKGNIISLSGTMVPATKLNSIIASIPIVGNILVGKKTGEGVVGVSFKMKGPPNDIKTTVNPIKTITPRFIVRAIEKLKKKKEFGVK